MISNADTDCDPDSDAGIDDSSRLIAKFRVTQGSPERHSPSGSHGQRPWFQVGMRLSPSLLLLLQLPALAQQSPQPPTTRIYFSALDRSERPVARLTAADFELRIDGKSSSLEGFREGSQEDRRSIPLVAWIMIDFNPNLQTSVIQQQAGSEIFTHFHPDSVVGVKLVSDRSETLAPLKHDANSLRSAFLEFGRRRTELRAGGNDDSVIVGPGGIMKAIELAIGEIDSCVGSTPALRNREIYRAIMILSDGNINPSYKTGPLCALAARDAVFLYPVFIPRAVYGSWVRDYFDLARKTGGVASVLGALSPGSEVLPLTPGNTKPNALSFNLLHMARDLEAKYSFTLATAGARETRIQVKCRVKDVRIRLPRQR